MRCAAMATQSFLRILQLLESHGVEYVVVGGVAAVLQGAPVTTFDLDTLIKVDAANADRLLAALEVLEARYREHSALRPTRDDLLGGGHLLLLTNSRDRSAHRGEEGTGSGQGPGGRETTRGSAPSTRLGTE